jgi:protein translocase SecG subunit
MNTIAILQIIVAVALIVLIMLQQRDGDAAGFLGGGGGGSSGGFYQQRRGVERLFFVLTIILTVAFAALALTSLFYHEPTESAQTTENASSTADLVNVDVSGAQTVNILPASTTTNK